VVIIDEGGEAKPLASELPQLAVTVLTSPRGSASAKRNQGVQAVRGEINLIAFMDDDIVVEPQALEVMMNFWESSPPELAGVGFNLVNHPPLFASRLKSLRLAAKLALYDSRGGAVLCSGVHTLIGFVSRTQYVQWLPSTAVVYRRQILAEYSFDEWYQGYNYLEDLDFSYGISRRFELAVLAEARVWHYPSRIGRTNAYLFGKKEVVNRLYFVRKHRELSPALCCLAVVVRALLSLFQGITAFQAGQFRRAWGNLVALFSSLTHGLKPVA